MNETNIVLFKMLKQKWIFAIAFTFLCGNFAGTSIDAASDHHRGRRDDNEDLADKIQMKVYTGSNLDEATITDIAITDSQGIYEQVNPDKPLAIYIHGFRNRPDEESITVIVEAYLNRGTDNIFVVDWSPLAFDDYPVVAARIPGIAKILAQLIDDLVDLGLDLETLHLIGHSMGAQISAFASEFSDNSIPRITGLDPANPGFYEKGKKHITEASARFVDIIHTDAGHFGAPINTGTVDFYPNNGTRPQRSCPKNPKQFSPGDWCAHWRSWRYYAESVTNNFAFPASPCSSYADYEAGNCYQRSVVYAGYATPNTANNNNGAYYFTTNDESPFGRGAENGGEDNAAGYR